MVSREVPSKVHPFSRGICGNLFAFCCSCGDIYTLEAVPLMDDLEARPKPYTCIDIISCRCCWYFRSHSLFFLGIVSLKILVPRYSCFHFFFFWHGTLSLVKALLGVHLYNLMRRHCLGFILRKQLHSQFNFLFFKIMKLNVVMNKKWADNVNFFCSYGQIIIDDVV